MSSFKTLLNGLRAVGQGMKASLDRLGEQIKAVEARGKAWVDQLEWVPIEEETVLLAEQSYTGFTNGGVSNVVVHEESGLYRPVTAGATYRVMWDGVAYRCLGQIETWFTAAYVGNPALMDLGEDNGLPFLFISLVSSGAPTSFICAKDEADPPADTHTIGITQLEFERLPEYYLSDELLAAPGVAAGAAETAENAMNTLNTKADKRDTVISGSFSQNRASGSAVGDYSHAEGRETAASGAGSHSEGYDTRAIGSYSHAEGAHTVANGTGAHAEGGDAAEYFYKFRITGEAGAKTYTYNPEDEDKLPRHRFSYVELCGVPNPGKFVYMDSRQTDSHQITFSETLSAGEALTDAYCAVRFGAFENHSHAEGTGTAFEAFSHAEGGLTLARGEYAHAEGYDTIAGGDYSHAEGTLTYAFGNGSHAEGIDTYAHGNGSHAEGIDTSAWGKGSHASGEGTSADSDYQFVHGRYNKIDGDGKYLHIVGNGTADHVQARSNAYTLDKNGVAWYQGRPQFGGTGQDSGSQSVMANGDKELILASSTENSTKKFRITVDDTGALTAAEVS